MSCTIECVPAVICSSVSPLSMIPRSNEPLQHQPLYTIISIYNLVELKSFVHKLLTQFARDRRETRDYYRVPHGDGYKGVDGR